MFPLGYYKPKTKYGFKVCKENDLNDCQLKYSDNERYIYQASDREYKKETERYELHGKTIYRTKAFVFKYKSVKLRLDEGLIKGENGNADSCKEGYRICGKFHVGQFPPYTILCFPWEYECPFYNIKGTQTPLSGSPYTGYVRMDEYHVLNFARYTENDYILGIFSGFFYNPMVQKENVAKLPFEFFSTITPTRQETVFSMEPFDLRDIFKENNIYSHYLDFYLKDSPIDTNNTFRFSLMVRFQNIWDLEKKCNVKKEPREEYVFHNYDGECLTMIEQFRCKSKQYRKII